MKDRRAHVERLRNDAAECATLSRLAVDEKKRELFSDLSARLCLLADEVERITGTGKAYESGKERAMLERRPFQTD